MEDNMNKKSVLITGASRGIGKACALAFARNGYHVFLNCNKSIEELKRVKSLIEQPKNNLSPAGTCDIVIGDVGNPACVESIFDQIRTLGFSLDVLINNAGISFIGLLTDMTPEEWNHVISTNLSSVFYCSKAALPSMISRRSGRIINISSMWGTAGASCEAAYSASKSGVHGLTKALAKELAPSNIQVNAIACGVIDTQMNQQLSDDERKELEDEIPMGRYGTPEEVAKLALLLAEGPEYMTGQIIGIDGGFL